MVWLTLLISGCAALGEGRGQTTLDLQLAGMAEVAGSRGYVFGHGTGASRSEARQAAQEELAQMLLAQVRSEVQSLERELHTPEGEHGVRLVRRELSVTTLSFAEVELEGALVDSERHASDGWYVRLRLAEAELHELRARARRHAPLLARLEAVAATPDELPGRRLRAALLGLATAHELQLEHAAVYQPGHGRTSFGAFFETEALQSAERLQAVPVVEGEGLRLVVIDRVTYSPQPNVTIRAAGQELTTDAAGYTPWIHFSTVPEPVEVVFLGYPLQAGGWRHPSPALLPADSFSRYTLVDTAQARLYVHTTPPGKLVRVGDVESVTPAVFTVDGGRAHGVSLPRQAGVQEAEHRIWVPAGAPSAYLSLLADPRRMGQVRLRAACPARLEVTGRDFQQLTEAGEFDGSLEAGRYSVRVLHPRGTDYQEVTDTLLVSAGGEVQRQYRPLRYREPRQWGLRLSLTGLRFGGEPGTDYALPWLYGEEIRYGELLDETAGVGLEYGANLDAMFSGQLYLNWARLTVQGAFGARQHQIGLEQLHRPSTTDLKLDVRHVSLGVGFWRPLFGDWVIGSITVNHAVESARWNSEAPVILQRRPDGPWEPLPSGEADNEYSYLELNTRLDLSWLLGPGYAFTVAVATPFEAMQPYLMVGIGFAFVDRRYRHAASAQARAGVHY